MTSRTDSKRWNLGRNRLVGGLLVLLPGFMFVGLLTPGAVTVGHDEEEARAAGPTTFRAVRSFKLPLLAPRDFSRRSIQDLVDLESLFDSGQLRAQDSPRIAGFQSIAGDTIVLAEADETDDVEQYVAEDLFEQPLEPEMLRVDLKPLWDSAIFDVIPPSWPLDPVSGSTQFDDLVGVGQGLAGPPQTPAVPEISTGALLGMGLVLLATRGRSRRS